MRSLRVAIVLFAAHACAAPPVPGPAVRLATDASDTVIINSRWPKALPVHALDAKGRTIAGAPIRFTWVNGAEVPVTNAGAVTCTRSGDLRVRALLDSLTTHVFVRCRLVEHVQIQGPIQFVLGDSELSRPRPLSVGVYAADGRPVSLFTASIMLLDSEVATLRGAALVPRSRGPTVVSVHIGDREGTMGVHIYQRVEALDALDTLLRVSPGQRAFAVPLRLESGAQYRQRLPPGYWMLSLLPHEDHGRNPIRMGVDGAACESNLLNDPGRLGCAAGSSASVVVYRPFSRQVAAAATGYLLVRWLAGGDPRRFVPRVPAMPGSLACVKQLLGERGYVVQQVSGDQALLRAERRDARLGTDARREWIEVQVETSDATLRGRAWAVDSYPRVESRPRAGNPLVVEPAEVTLTHAREALQQCGRGK
jgi:hypothetical protein